MNEAQGMVASLDGEYAWVRMDEAGCGRCHEVGGCGGQRLEKIFCKASSVPVMHRVHNPDKARPGERVTVAMPAGALARGAMQAYGLPLLTLFVGAFGGLALVGETGAMAGAGLGMLAGWVALSRFRSAGADAAPEPYIKR